MATLQEPVDLGGEASRLEVRVSGDRAGRGTRVYDLGETRPLPGDMPDLSSALEVLPSETSGPILFPVVAIHRRCPEILNSETNVFFFNNTPAAFTVAGLITRNLDRRRPQGGTVLPPGGLLPTGKLTPKDWDRPRLAALYRQDAPGRPGGDLFLEFPLQVFPVETVPLPGVGEGALILPWPPEKATPFALDYEVMPGRSIGPIRLGMTRGEIEALGLGPRLEDERLIHFPVPVSGRSWDWQSVGLRVFFEGGACSKLEAWLSMNESHYRLSGRILDGMDEAEFAAVLQSLGGTVERRYASVAAPSLGIGAVKWESSDSIFTTVEVFPAS